MAAAVTLLSLAAGLAHALPASDWVAQSRTPDTQYSAEGKIKFDVSGDGQCQVTATKGGQPAPQGLKLQAGVGNIVEVCSNGPGPHYFTAGGLFQNSAFRKVQSSSAGGAASGYASSAMLRECVAKSGGCCAAYIVPVTPGQYPVNDINCNTPLGTIEVTGPAPAQGLDQMPRNLLQQDVPADAVWADALQIDVALVQQPTCQPAAPSPGGRRRLRQASPAEGDAEDVAGGAFNLRFVYAGGHTNVKTDFLGLPNIEDGAGTPAAPAATEGTDGVSEGEGEGRVAASPGPGEGADNTAEGAGEGAAADGATPSPVEGTEGSGDNEFEGTNEGAVEGGPGDTDGAEGTNEGAGPTAAPVEGGPGDTDGVEGTNEGAGPVEGGPGDTDGAEGTNEGAEPVEGAPGDTNGAEGTNEGAVEGGPGDTDGVEGTNEGAEPVEGAPGDTDGVEGTNEGEGSRRLLQTPTPAEGEGADGVEEGAGEGVSTASFLAVEAEKHPIEMVAGRPYKIRFRLIGSTANHYFTAPQFFAKAHIAQFVDEFAALKFVSSPTQYELFGDEAYVVFWVQPKAAGTFEIKSGELPAAQLKTGKIKVVAGEAQLTAPGKLALAQVAGACGASQQPAPPGQGTPAPVVSPAPPAAPGAKGEGAAQGAPSQPASPTEAAAAPSSQAGLAVSLSVLLACVAGAALFL